MAGPGDTFTTTRPSGLPMKYDPGCIHRRTAWGVQGGRKRPQAARPAGHLTTVSGVVRPQGVERSGMAGLSESPWPHLPYAHVAFTQFQKSYVWTFSATLVVVSKPSSRCRSRNKLCITLEAQTPARKSSRRKIERRASATDSRWNNGLNILRKKYQFLERGDSVLRCDPNSNTG
jgi:hypothetical protein